MWRAVFPDDPPTSHAAIVIPAKLAIQPELFLLARDEGHRVIGTVMGGYDGHRGWIYRLAVDPAERRCGVGAALVRAIEERLALLGCPKINLQIRSGNDAVVGFYEQLGFVVEPRVSMGRRIA